MRLPIRAVVVRSAQRTGNAPNSLDTKRIHKWISARADIGFDELGQASRPVLAVIAGGILYVSSGSTSAIRGSIKGFANSL